MTKNKSLIILGAAMMACLCGCQKNPESSIVTNKDFDNMIEQAENTEGGVTDVAEVAVNYDTYQTTYTDESLAVTVNVDAKVDIPETNQMSVFRVTTKTFSQDFLDKIMITLTPGVTYYDGQAIDQLTKSDIESSIQYWKDEIANLTEEDYIAEYQRYIDELQEQYENAPDTLEVDKYPSDNKLHNVGEMYNNNPDDEYYSWQYEFDTNAEVFYGVNDAKDGNYISLYVQNNANYGNSITYRSSKQGYVFTSSVLAEAGGSNDGMWKADVTDIAQYLRVDKNPSEIKEVTNEPLTISEEQAKQQAEELINSLGITDLKCVESDIYCEIPDIRTMDYDCSYRKVYRVRYMRNIDGAFVNNEGGTKHAEGWDGDDYVKKDWVGEEIVVYINDSGIVGFDYAAPLEILETVVDKSNLKTFDEIKGIFEQMSVVVNAKDEATVNITVDRVMLRYTRISEADNYDTGLLVPAWDFIGTISVDYGGYPDVRENVNILTINAIDGSIIDRELGY